MARHIIRTLKLNEISGVDRPAQPGALACLMKRAPEPAPKTDPQETTMFKTREELLAAIAKFNKDGGTPAEITLIQKSATTLKAEADLPDILKGAPVADPALAATVERLTKVAGLRGAHRDHFDTLAEVAAQDAFLNKSVADRDAELAQIELNKAGDPVVHTCLDGTVIRKSDGATVLSMAKKLDQQSKDLAIEKATRIDTDLTKRAETDLGDLAGTVDERKALLKAVDGITDETTRENILKTLRSANAAAGNGAPLGGSDIVVVAKSAQEADDKLEELAKAHQTTHKVDFAKAYGEVLETPEGRKLYAISSGQPAQ